MEGRVAENIPHAPAPAFRQLTAVGNANHRLSRIPSKRECRRHHVAERRFSMAWRGNNREFLDLPGEQLFQIADHKLMAWRCFEGRHHRLRKPAKRPPCQGQAKNLGGDHTITVGEKNTTVTSKNYG